MTAYRYVKSIPKEKKVISKRWSVVPLMAGLALLVNAAYPIVAYRLISRGKIKRPPLSPLGQIRTEVLGRELDADFRRPDIWFPSAPKLTPRPSKITHYRLSIPKLGIEEAVVEIGGTDLMESLVHYSGTAFPGQIGNAVIFGHSTLVQFFSPKSYRTIFSTLDRLEKGDELVVNYDGIEYHYFVESLIEVQPTNISVLSQDSEDYLMSLITCVPQGTYLRRLVVRARLI